MLEITTQSGRGAVQIQSAVRGWLARRLCTDLARELYQICLDEASGKRYYRNSRTGAVWWSQPPLFWPRGDEKRMIIEPAKPLSTKEGSCPITDDSSAPQHPPDAVVAVCPGRRHVDGEEFLARCTQEKQNLYEAHRRTVMRSMRRWEQQQMREKTLARVNRLSKAEAENHKRLVDLQQGAKAYNLKSIRQAAVQGDVTRLVELLDQGFDADASSAMGLTPLLGASQSGCLEAVKILLQRGADVNHQHAKTKRTALMEASARESAEVVRELLRYGARLYVRDAHGETAFDGAKDALIRRYLELATSTWSSESAEVFPEPFRSAGKTLLLVRKRQSTQCNEKRTMTKRELAALRPTMLRSAAEAKMRYDEQVRESHSQVSLLGKVDVLRRADSQYDEDRSQLLRAIERALLSKAEAEQPRELPSASIATILAFCDRHWFDLSSISHHAHDRKPKRNRKRVKHNPVEPTKTRAKLPAVPEPIAAEWNELQRVLQDRCEELRRAQCAERPDAENGVTRNRADGQTLSTLRFCVVEAQHLPFRDPRVRDPIDPFVRVTLRDRVENCMSVSTECRLGDRHPTWNADFSFRVESVKGDVLVQLMDAKRKEVAGEVVVALRTLVDQKQHDEWFLVPPTLRQQALEKAPREHAARVRLALRLVHTPSMLLTREIQQLLTTRAEVLRRKLALMQSALEECVQKLAMA